MVVDLFQPRTAPICAEPTLWFEFLLNQKLLIEHLQHPNPKPSATQLITDFLSVNASNGSVNSESFFEATRTSQPQLFSHGRKMTRKQLGLKILALKIASSLNWNLDTFETKLAPLIQQQLIQDLVFMASDGAFFVPPQEFFINMIMKPQMQFALTLYHRWVLRFPPKFSFRAKSTMQRLINIPGTAENSFTRMKSSYESILKINENNRMQSIQFLENVIAFYKSYGNSDKPKQIKVPVMETFVHLTENMDKMAHNWNAGCVYISQHELLMQIHFDLCLNYFFYGEHEKAKKHILDCRKNQKLLEYVQNTGYEYDNDKLPWGNLKYASMSEDDILGYIRALNLGQELDENTTLLHRLQESVSNNYSDIIAVLQADNLSREIPIIHRQVVELEIQAATSTGASSVPQDLLVRVSALNAVRYALQGGLPATHPDFLNKFKILGVKFFDVIFWALAPVLISSLSEDDWHKLRIFFLHLATTYQYRLPIDRIDEYLQKYIGDRALEIRGKLLSDEHLEVILKDQIESDDENMDLPRELLEDWDFEYQATTELDIGRLKKRLVEASNAEDVRTCLLKLATTSSPSWKLNPYCKPIGDLRELLEALPRGFLQDFSALVSGAAQARAEAGDARAAFSLMSVVESETRNHLASGYNPSLSRLCSAVSWEVLLLQVNLLLSEWPHHRLDVSLLTRKCKEAIAAAADSDENAPPSQVVLAAWLGLLNIGCWEPVAGRIAGSGAHTIAASIVEMLCRACSDLQRGKGTRKFPRELWDQVLNMFNISTGSQKHTQTSHHHLRNHPKHSDQARSAYYLVIQGLREPLAISILLSLLAKLYNILVENPVELVVEYTELWPKKMANVNNYDSKHVLEVLTELLNRILKIYPYNISWLQLYGDAEMAAGRYAPAVKHYLCAIAVSSHYFTMWAPNVTEVAKRAAQCCRALGAPTQAAALCQVPAQPDYSRAFTCLADKVTNCADSMDAYYGCIWDGTLLEVAVAGHARRNEVGRRARAIAAIGALELNPNNSEEIRREAAAVRRARLLRALTDQYVC